MVLEHLGRDTGSHELGRASLLAFQLAHWCACMHICTCMAAWPHETTHLLACILVNVGPHGCAYEYLRTSVRHHLHLPQHLCRLRGTWHSVIFWCRLLCPAALYHHGPAPSASGHLRRRCEPWTSHLHLQDPASHVPPLLLRCSRCSRCQDE